MEWGAFQQNKWEGGQPENGRLVRLVNLRGWGWGATWKGVDGILEEGGTFEKTMLPKRIPLKLW